MARPDLVAIRARKPNLRARLILEGLYVDCIGCLYLFVKKSVCAKKGRGRKGLLGSCQGWSVIFASFLPEMQVNALVLTFGKGTVGPL